MGAFPLALIVAAFLCSLVAGFLFAFAVVVMPGIRRLGDRGFLRAFRSMDRVIQDNQPLFILVWVGSALALVAAAVLGVGRLAGLERWLLLGATLAYLLGVQLPTIAVNIPLNNRLQALDVDRLTDDAATAARRAFEPRWNRWNVARTLVACVVTALLLVLLTLL